MSLVVKLPFPMTTKLSQNARAHWRKKARLTRLARQEGFYLAKAALAGKPGPSDRPLKVRFSFNPPDRRPRDRDNVISALKAYCDGVADAIGVDDAEWESSYEPFGPVIKGGRVTLQFGEAE